MDNRLKKVNIRKTMRKAISRAENLLLNVGPRIREYRKKKKLTQKELGKLIGCDGCTISLYERGKFNPAAPIIVALADVFNTTTDELLRGDFFSTVKSSLKEHDNELLPLFNKIRELPQEDRVLIRSLVDTLVSKNNSIT